MKIKSFLMVFLLCTGHVITMSTAVAGGEESSAASHGTTSERLQNIMQNLNLSVTDTNNPDNQPEDIAATDLQEMQEAVEELLFHAELMSRDYLELGLTGSRQVTFRALAGQLYTETLNIKRVVENYSSNDEELLYSAWQRLYETCAACHEQFRDR